MKEDKTSKLLNGILYLVIYNPQWNLMTFMEKQFRFLQMDKPLFSHIFTFNTKC